MTAAPAMAPDTLFVAAFGTGASHGLYRWRFHGDVWAGNLLFTVSDLCALAAHPTLPVLYGVSGTDAGRVHAWRVSSADDQELGERDSGGALPAHVAIDPGGRFAVVANYASGSVSVHRLDPDDGSFDGASSILALTGSGSDPERQEASHPHQAVFDRDRLYVVDLGSDAVWVFAVHSDNPVEGALELIETLQLPAGTGPRHLALLGSNRAAVSGELGSLCMVGSLTSSGDTWTMMPSTQRMPTIDDSTVRNYPGDVQASTDRRHVYLANRGFDSVATFEIGTENAQPVAEADSGVRWPQHFLVRHDHLLVAGRDSSAVVALPLIEGLPGSPRHLFDCPNPVWLLHLP